MRMTVIMTVSVKSDSDSEKSNMQNNINSLTKPRCNINSMQKISYFWSHSSKNQLPEFISAMQKKISLLCLFLFETQPNLETRDQSDQTKTRQEHTQPKIFQLIFDVHQFISKCKKSGYFNRSIWFKNPGSDLRNHIFPKFGVCAGTQQIIQNFIREKN